MKKIVLIYFFVLATVGCVKEQSNEAFFDAQIVGYNLNCSTCLLYFPNDSVIVGKITHEKGSIYEAVNLNQKDFKIGEWIRVGIENEANPQPCITMYPSFKYPYIHITKYVRRVEEKTIDTIEVAYGNCITTLENTKVCFEGVAGDSRCPKGAYCLWEGNAVVELSVDIQGSKHKIELNTNSSFRTDTIIRNTHLSIVSLRPYPEIGKEINVKEYVVALSVAKLHMLK
ncbi:MAG: hypothetical protein N2662_05715 [Bacteroidales bacterium]|nr:hypothetical protein [Bacteroidales bacterium]